MRIPSISPLFSRASSAVLAGSLMCAPLFPPSATSVDAGGESGAQSSETVSFEKVEHNEATALTPNTYQSGTKPDDKAGADKVGVSQGDAYKADIGYDFTEASSSDGATVQVETNVKPGGTMRITGKNWVNEQGNAGSVLAIKLNYTLKSGGKGQYSREGNAVITHPISNKPEPTIWALAYADASGNFSSTIDLPAQLVQGQRFSLSFASGAFAAGDKKRTVQTPPLIVGGVPWIGDKNTDVGGMCVPETPDGKPTYEIDKRVTNGKLHVKGWGWCHPTNGGSVIAFKIDDGKYKRLNEDILSNDQVWAVAEADAAHGNWEIDITVPDGTDKQPNGSSPIFPEGEHSLRMLTGSLKDGDKVRTFGPESANPTTFTLGEYQPSGVPTPLEYNEQLTDDTAGNLDFRISPRAMDITIPDSEEGSWVYVSAYVEDGSVRLPWENKWFRTNADGRISVPLDDVKIPSGSLKIVAQSGEEGENGALLGWGWLTLLGAFSDGLAPEINQKSYTDTPPKEVLPLPVRNFIAPPVAEPARILATPSIMANSRPIKRATKLAPATIPAAPYAQSSDLVKSNAGGVSAVQKGSLVTLKIPSVKAGDWVYVYTYDPTISVGWIQADNDKQIKVDIKGLPAGQHKIALLSESGDLLGWANSRAEDQKTGDVRFADPQTIQNKKSGSAEATPTPASAAATAMKTMSRSGLTTTDAWLIAGSVLIAAVVLVVALMKNRPRSSSH